MKTSRLLFLFFSLFYISCEIDLPYHEIPLPALHEAVEEDDLEKVKKLLSGKECASNFREYERLRHRGELCFNVNYTDYHFAINRTALFHVKSLEMAEFLISQGADVKIRDISGYTPLHFANTPAIAKLFLDHGSDIESKNNDDGETPLYKAVYDKRYDVAEFLFKQGANPYAEETDSGESALDIAEERSLNKLVKLFKTYSPPDEKDDTETNP